MGDDEGMFVFFGSQNSNALPHAEAVEQDFIGVDIQFLLDLSLDIRLAARPKNVGEAGATDVASARKIGVVSVVSIVSMVIAASEDRSNDLKAQGFQTKI